MRETYTIPRFIARRAVVQEIRRRGEKTRGYSAKALYEMADDYILDHVEDVMREVLAYQETSLWKEWHEARGRLEALAKACH